MARVTVEDCLARVPNRFALTVLASRRARAISEGRGRPLVDCENKAGVTALREISADRVRYKEVVADTLTEFIEQQRRQLRVTTGEHTFLEAASLRALEDDEDDDEDGVEEPDVEELQADPEKLNKQAQGDSTSDDDSDGDSESTSESADTPSADADDLDTEALGDDDSDDTDDSGDGDGDGDGDATKES